MFGNFIIRLFINEFFWFIFLEIFNLFLKFQNIKSPFKIWIFAKLLIVLDEPEDIQKILASPFCYEKGASYDIFPGDGLLKTKRKSKF